MAPALHFTLPCRGRVGARSAPGWGDGLRTRPHPAAPLTAFARVDPPPSGEGDQYNPPVPVRTARSASGETGVELEMASVPMTE